VEIRSVLRSLDVVVIVAGQCRLAVTCAGGAEARQFNRMLIDAGRIKNL